MPFSSSTLWIPMFFARFVDCAAAQSLSVWAVIIMHGSCCSKLILQMGRLSRCAPTPAIMRESWFVGLLAVPLPSRRSCHCFSPWEGPQVCSLSVPVLRGGSRRFSGPFPSPSRSPVLRLSGCDFQGPHSRFVLLVVIPDALVTDVEVLRQRPV